MSSYSNLWNIILQALKYEHLADCLIETRRKDPVCGLMFIVYSSFKQLMLYKICFFVPKSRVGHHINQHIVEELIIMCAYMFQCCHTNLKKKVRKFGRKGSFGTKKRLKKVPKECFIKASNVRLLSNYVKNNM